MIVETCFNATQTAVRMARTAFCLCTVCCVIAGSVVFHRHGDSGCAISSVRLLTTASFVSLILLWMRRAEILQMFLITFVLALSAMELAEVYWPVGRHLQISASIPIAAGTALAIGCLGEHGQNTKTITLVCMMSAGIGIVLIHVLVLSMIIHSRYDYDIERNFHVCGRLCLVTLLSVQAWMLSHRHAVRVAGAIAGLLFYIYVTVYQ